MCVCVCVFSRSLSQRDYKRETIKERLLNKREEEEASAKRERERQERAREKNEKANEK